MAGGHAPDWVIALAGHIGLIPLPLVMPVAVALAWLPLRQSAFGRNLLASGGDPRAAFASGVDVAKVRFIAYIASSVIAAATGFAFTVSLGSGDPTAAAPYTLIGVAGAVLGGVSLSGGRGGLLGAAAGGAVLFLVQNILSVSHLSSFYAQVAYGAILILALTLNGIVDRSRRRPDRAANLVTA
jgi:ribose transport system permease protein